MNGREKYIASQAPRVRRTHPARSAQALNTSGAGIVHRQMMDLQRQPNLNKADTARLKDLRKDWNRNRKYTDAGMKISGASSPLDAQKYFVDTTRDFRDTNRDAYASMYPLTNMAMEYPQKGGILGMMAKNIFGKVSDFGKSIINKEGIAGASDSDEAEMKDYAAQTFGFYPSDVHPGLISEPYIEGPSKSTVLPNIHTGEIYYDRGEGLDFEDDPNQPNVAPDNYVEKDFGDFYIDADTLAPERGLPFDDSVREDYIRRQNEYVSPPPVFPGNVRKDPQETDKWLRYLTAPELGAPNPQKDFPVPEYTGPLPDISIQFGEPDIPPIIPFDDSGRETGIASLYGQGPRWAETDRRYEDEYRDYTERMGDMVGGPMTYEEFERAWERVHQGKPHSGLR